MRLAAAELVDRREILPGQWLQAYHAPDLAVGSRAGQFIHVRPGDFSGMILRRPFSLNTTDPATGTVTIHFRVIGRGTAWFTHLRPGDRIDLLGPLGRPFEVDSRSRHLLLVAGGLGIAGVRMLADEAIRGGRQVTLLFGAASAREVYPSTLLPDEVEYVVATDDGSFGHHGRVTELLGRFEAWADQCFACGPLPMLAAMAHQAAGRQARLGVASLGARRGRGSKAPPLGSRLARRRAWLQVSMEQNMGCAVGACLGLRHHGGQRAATGVPRGPGVRRERDRVGGSMAVEVVGAGQQAGVEVDLAVDLGRGLVLRNPLLVASGTFGYGIEYGDVVDVQGLGAICSKGTTLRPRVGNPPPRVTETPAGMLNSIGTQNPHLHPLLDKYT